MKNILITTDFSDNATHAAEYGYQLALRFKANIILFNAFAIPVESPQASLAMWPAYEYDEITENCEEYLGSLKDHLEVLNKTGFKPEIKCVIEAGALTDIIENIIETQEISLVVMGAHSRGGLSGLVVGNHVRHLIDNAKCPMLLVPPFADQKPVKKIAVALDQRSIAKDLNSIYEAINIAKLLNSEILLSFVVKEEGYSGVFEKYLKGLLPELCNKADYPHINYRLIKNNSVEDGLEWLCENGEIDILAMVHQPHSLLTDLLRQSHTKKMADRMTLPLFIFPEKISKN